VSFEALKLESSKLKTRPEQCGRHKRRRESGQTLSDTDSNHEENEADVAESISTQRHPKRERRRSSPRLQSRRERLRSPSPIYDWEDFKDISPPDLSEETRNESQMPSSDRPDSSSEVDWESFLCKDSEMLPSSNWEAEFLEHQARIIDRHSYKEWTQNEDYSALEDPEDAPWHPYDPEDVMLQDFESEVHAESLDNELEGQNTICYGVVSIL